MEVDQSTVSTVTTAMKSSQIPSLDGLRAIAIVCVLFGHLSGTRHLGRLQTGIGDIARLGVVVFFVISGFLITSLLIAEHAKTGRISLKLFYARRALRILPASYMFIAVVSLLWWLGVIQLHIGDLLHSVTYTVNYYPFKSWYIGHLWSLSVEEQFYLLWPLAVAALGPRSAPRVAFIVLLLGPIARSAAWMFLRGTPYYEMDMFPMVADSLAAGCLLAKFRLWLENQDWYLRLFRLKYSLVLLGVVLVLNRLQGYTIASVAGMSLINVLLAIIIHRCVYCSGDRAGRVLNWRPVAFVGVLSYSLYLWQQLFLNRHSDAWATGFPQNLIFAVLAALASYLLLERPLLKLRNRLRTASPAAYHSAVDTSESAVAVKIRPSAPMCWIDGGSKSYDGHSENT